MIPIVLDTNAYSEFKRGNEPVVRAIETAEEVLLPSPVLGELYAGFRMGSQEAKNVMELHQFLDRTGVKAGAVDRAVARRYGDLVAALRAAGTPIPTNDIWIAAVCIEHNGELLTGDKHFADVPLLRLVHL